MNRQIMKLQNVFDFELTGNQFHSVLSKSDGSTVSCKDHVGKNKSVGENQVENDRYLTIFWIYFSIAVKKDSEKDLTLVLNFKSGLPRLIDCRI